MDGGTTYQAVDEFCSSMRYERNASEHSVKAYRGDVLAYAAWAADNGVDVFSATRKDVRSYLGYMREQRYESSTINRHVSALRSFYRWAVLSGRCEANPANEVASPKRAKTLPRALRAEEIDALNADAGEEGAKAASLIVEAKDGKRSYKIIAAPPEGRSYAMDIAEKYGVTYELLTGEKRPES